METFKAVQPVFANDQPSITLALIALLCLAVPVLNLAVSADSAFYVVVIYGDAAG